MTTPKQKAAAALRRTIIQLERQVAKLRAAADKLDPQMVAMASRAKAPKVRKAPKRGAVRKAVKRALKKR